MTSITFIRNNHLFLSCRDTDEHFRKEVCIVLLNSLPFLSPDRSERTHDPAHLA
jgi:hypothetical protein